MQTINDMPVTREEISPAEEKLKPEKQLTNGANWFFWIAGLSMVNSVIVLLGGQWHFLSGLGITQLIDAVAMYFAASVEPSAGAIIRVLAFLMNLDVAIVFLAFGLLAYRKHTLAFIIGMALYGIDGIVFVMVQDFMSIGFHVFVLYGLYGGLRASRSLGELTPAPAEGVTLRGAAPSASNLMWNMLWRGTLWSTLAGAVLGAAYLCLFVASFLILQPILQLQSTNETYSGNAIELWVSTMFFSAFLGGISGATMGIVFAPIGGLLCALFTRLLFFPVHNMRLYRWLVGILGAIYGAIVTLGSLWLGIYMAVLVSPPTNEEEVTAAAFAFGLIGLIVLPGLIGGAAGAFISRRMAAWNVRAGDVSNAGRISVQHYQTINR